MNPNAQHNAWKDARSNIFWQRRFRYTISVELWDERGIEAEPPHLRCVLWAKALTNYLSNVINELAPIVLPRDLLSSHYRVARRDWRRSCRCQRTGPFVGSCREGDYLAEIF